MPIENLEEFNKGLDKFIKSIPEEFINVAHRKIALDILTGVTKRTPVDKGRARLNWQLSIGTPAADIKEVGQSGGPPLSAGAVPSLQEVGQTVVDEANKELKNLKPFGTAFISNNVNYIGYLDEGSSQQAPAGMVAATLQEIGGTF